MESWAIVWELDTAVKALNLGFGALDVKLGELNLRSLDSSYRKLSLFLIPSHIPPYGGLHLGRQGSSIGNQG